MTPSSGTLLRPFARRFNRSVEEARNASKARRRRVAMRHSLSAGEQLEQRAVFAVDAFSVQAGGAITKGWVSIVASEGDDVYVSQMSPADIGASTYDPSLFYGDNSSFVDAGEIKHIGSIPEVFISSAALVKGTTSGVGLTAAGYPFLQNADGSNSFSTVFSLRDDLVRADDYYSAGTRITGEIRNGVGGSWTFVRDFNGVFAISPISASGPSPQSMTFIDAPYSNYYGGGPDSITVTWDTNAVGAGGMSSASPPTLTASYYSGHYAYSTRRDIPASVDTTARFPLLAPAGIADGAPFTIAAGTLRGTIVSPDGDFSIPFTTSSARSTDLVFLQNNQYSNVAYFNDRTTSGRMFGGKLEYDKAGRPQIKVSFDSFYDRGSQGFFNAGPRFTGAVSVVADYGVANAPPASDAISDCTIVAGLDFNRQLSIDMGTPGATIRIDSPLVNLPSLDLRASNIVLDAPVSSSTSFTVGASASGATCEQLFFNAAMSAQAFDLRLADDPASASITRSKIFVSPSGSLGGGGPSAAPTNANTLFAQVIGGDVLIEGIVAVDTQSWLLQSPQAASDDAVPVVPYVMSTTAVVSGASTGLIKGKAIAITLGNDLPSLYDNTAIGGSTALSVVTLQTDIDSLRITAADRKGNPLATPFPYDVQISEGALGGDGSFSVDAVSASSRTLEFKAVNNIVFNASLASAGDVIVSSDDGKIILNAPISTAFGSISLEANSLTIGNSVRVLDTSSDPSIVDIRLVARKGDMLLSGPVAAVNTIALVQNGAGNVIRGPSRLIARRLDIRSEGSASLVTSVDEVTGTVGGGLTISEADTLVLTDVSAGNKRVSVTVGGEDYYLLKADGTSDFEGGRQPALRATLSDVTELVASAPKGSIDIMVNTTEALRLGNVAEIQSRIATSMMAAGSVRISTSAGSIDAYDAPFAGSSARLVSAASTGDLAGVFDARQPGVYSATLTASANGYLTGKLLDGTLLGQATKLDGVSDLQTGDLVLLKDQSEPNKNGIYRIVSLGSSKSKWVLARADDFDTTAEAKVNTWVRVARGETQAGKLFTLSSFGDLEALKLATEPDNNTARMVTAVTNAGNAYAVRAVSSTPLAGTYTQGNLLEGTKEGALPLFDGVRLVEGDVVLVRYGHVFEGKALTSSIGVYEVVVVGDDSTAWQLKRVDDFAIGRVVSNEGSLRASRTGQALAVAYDYLNEAPMNFVEVSDSDVPMQIGSGDINDSVRFIVSTNLGTNNSLGSLGKSLLLVQGNRYQVQNPEDPTKSQPQKQSLAFASTLAPNGSFDATIRLSQELPQITTTVRLDAFSKAAIPGAGSAAVVIDGSRITTRRDYSAVTATNAPNGIEVVGDKASGSVVSGLVFGGFAKGAAVVVDGASDVLLSGLRIGEDAAGKKLGNKQGIAIRNGAGGFTTLLNSSIRSTTGSAIQVGKDSTDVDTSLRIVGSTVGGSGSGNVLGIELNSGTNLVGAAPVDVSLKRITVTRPKDKANANQFLMPAGFAQQSLLRAGLGVVSNRIVPSEGKAVAVIDQISAPDDKGIVTVTIKDGVIDELASSFVIDIGNYALAEDDPTQMMLPSGIDIRDVFLGQSISGTNVGPGTTIVAIEKQDGADNAYMLTLSQPLLRTDLQAVVFAAAGRNQVLANNYGIVQRSGTSRIINTSIGSSVFDGIQINGGTATVGLGVPAFLGVGGRSASKDRVFGGLSNTIYGSGLSGIRIGKDVPASAVTIQGNYLGVTDTGASSANRSGNILAASPSTVADRTLTGSVTNATGTLEISLAGHGLSTGAVVWLKIGANTKGNAYRITWKDENTFTATMLGVANSTAKPAISDRVTVSVYGSKARAIELANTGSVDFEGNQHGLAVALPVTPGSTPQTPAGSGGSGGVAAGRPVLRPVSRPFGR